MIYECRVRGGRIEDIHFEAKSDEEADRQARAYCAARVATFVYVKPWLIDLSGFEGVAAGSAPADAPHDRPSVEEQRERMKAKHAGMRVGA